MELRELTAKIQIKLHQYHRRLGNNFSRPHQKFIYQMLFGILKGGKVQLNNIARQLQDGLSLKKSTERLGRHLGVNAMWEKISESTLETQSYYLRQCKYMILDLSDIQKRYAEQMDGLGMVYDGSEKQEGLGYWLCNVTGVDESGSLIAPAYSELYSLVEESGSENRKILDAIERVSQVVGREKIWVDDRGGDRKSIMEPLLRRRSNSPRALKWRKLRRTKRLRRFIELALKKLTYREPARIYGWSLSKSASEGIVGCFVI